MSQSETLTALNCLASFLAAQDLAAPVRSVLKTQTGLEQADVMVLFGGSILSGADVLAQAMEEKLARTFVIVGGHGHTTDALRSQLKADCPDLDETLGSEAELFNQYLMLRHHKKADLLETRSTNCGNNITLLLDLLKAHRIPCQSMIVCQDASMQRRMMAGLQKYAPSITIISCPAYLPEFREENGALVWARDIPGMWTIEEFIRLMMGEMVRLADTVDGYGPAGKNFIAHVEIPEAVVDAFHLLQKDYASFIRPARAEFASESTIAGLSDDETV